MTRTECEWRIYEHMRAIEKIYAEYNPAGNYLDLAIVGGNIQFNNKHYDEDKQNPIDFWKEGKK